MKIEGTHDTAPFNFQHWRDASRLEWEKSLLEQQPQFEQQRDVAQGKAKSTTKDSAPPLSSAHGFGASLEQPVKGLQALPFVSSPYALLKPTTSERPVVSAMSIQTGASNWGAVSSEPMEAVRTALLGKPTTTSRPMEQPLPNALRQYSGSLLSKTSSNEATLWLGLPDESQLKRIVRQVQQWCKNSSIALIRVVYRGQDVSSETLSFQDVSHPKEKSRD